MDFRLEAFADRAVCRSPRPLRAPVLGLARVDAQRSPVPGCVPLELPAADALAPTGGLLRPRRGGFLARRAGAAAWRAERPSGSSLRYVGWCASRWPQLSRAIELCGGVFLGVVLSALLMTALAATCAALAAALVRDDWRPLSRRIMLCLVAVWALATFGVSARSVSHQGLRPALARRGHGRADKSRLAHARRRLAVPVERTLTPRRRAENVLGNDGPGKRQHRPH